MSQARWRPRAQGQEGRPGRNSTPLGGLPSDYPGTQVSRLLKILEGDWRTKFRRTHQVPYADCRAAPSEDAGRSWGPRAPARDRTPGSPGVPARGGTAGSPWGPELATGKGSRHPAFPPSSCPRRPQRFPPPASRRGPPGARESLTQRGAAPRARRRPGRGQQGAEQQAADGQHASSSASGPRS